MASGSRQAEAHFSPCGKKLFLFGISADRISKCGQVCDHDDDLPPFASWKATSECSARAQNYIAGGIKKAAYWRTIILDVTTVKGEERD